MFYSKYPKTTINQQVTTYPHINIQLIFILLILLLLIFRNGIIPYYQSKGFHQEYPNTTKLNFNILTWKEAQFQIV